MMVLMKHTGLLFILAIVMLTGQSCRHKPKPERTAAMDKFDESYVITCRTVVVQPFDGFPDYLSQALYEQIREINPEAIINKPIPLPADAYDERFGSYRADLLLERLKKGYNAKEYIVLGVTHEDLIRLNDEGLEQPTMGLAVISGYVSVVSSYQLSKRKIQEQLYHLSMHEIGHNEGMQHCRKYRNCFMYRGMTNNRFWGADFCHSCKMYMVLKGWEM